MINDPKLSTTVRHSLKNSAWNVVGTVPGGKYKIARVPYITTTVEAVDQLNRQEAYKHAMFISYCFNNSEAILKNEAKL